MAKSNYSAFILLLCFFSIGCVSKPLKSPLEAEEHIIKMAIEGNIEAVRLYIEENGIPLDHQPFSHAPKYLSITTNSEYTYAEFLKEYNHQNSSVWDLKKMCESKDPGYMRLKCLTQYPAPCKMEKESHVCHVTELTDAEMYKGFYELRNPGNLQGLGRFTNDDNLKWYLSQLDENIQIANKDREPEINQLKGEVTERKKESGKTAQECSRRGIKHLFQAILRVEKNLGDGSLLVKHMGVGSKGYICGSMRENLEKLSKLFVVKDLKGAKPYQCKSVYISFLKEEKFINEDGFEVMTPVWLAHNSWAGDIDKSPWQTCY